MTATKHTTSSDISEAGGTALNAPRQAVQDAMDRADSAFSSAREQTATSVARLASQAESLARRSVEAVRGSAHQARERASNLGDQTMRYVKDEPVKSVLIAAAAGAALMGLLSLLQNARRNRR